MLAAIDALADRCPTGDEGEQLSGRLLNDLRTAPDVGSWPREAHALVAAARRLPDRAAMAMPVFRTHNVGEVDPRGMAIVDSIQEGTRIMRIQMIPDRGGR